MQSPYLEALPIDQQHLVCGAASLEREFAGTYLPLLTERFAAIGSAPSASSCCSCASRTPAVPRWQPAGSATSAVTE